MISLQIPEIKSRAFRLHSAFNDSSPAGKSAKYSLTSVSQSPNVLTMGLAEAVARPHYPGVERGWICISVGSSNKPEKEMGEKPPYNLSRSKANLSSSIKVTTTLVWDHYGFSIG
jgi:hypothetical protein